MALISRLSTIFLLALLSVPSTGKAIALPDMKQLDAIFSNIKVDKASKHAAAFGFIVLSSYLALTQDVQPVVQKGSTFTKAINWYRRVICGNISKKKPFLQPNGEVKDTYTKSSGLIGTLISWYDANEKDVKKAAAIGALFLVATINTDIFDILGNLMKDAPYNNLFTQMKNPNLAYLK